MAEPQRIARPPDKCVILMSNGRFQEKGHMVKRIQMNLYIQKKDERFGPYSLLTAYIETDKGSIEMTYDEGYRGEHALEDAVAFLTSHLGISALVLRSIIQLENSINSIT